MKAFIDEHREVYGVEPIGSIPPAEAEAAYYTQLEVMPMAA